MQIISNLEMKSFSSNLLHGFLRKHSFIYERNVYILSNPETLEIKGNLFLHIVKWITSFGDILYLELEAIKPRKKQAYKPYGYSKNSPDLAFYYNAMKINVNSK